MIHLHIPSKLTTSFLKRIIEVEKRCNNDENVKIKTTYGSMKNDPIGSAREPDRLEKELDYRNIKDYTSLSRDNNLQFFYALNTPAVTSLHLDESKRPESFIPISRHLANLKKAGVERLIVASFPLAKFAAEEFGFMIKVSVVSEIKSLLAIEMVSKQFPNIEMVSLSTRAIDDLSLVREMNRVISLEILSNELCLIDCPYREQHYITEGISRTGERSDWYLKLCSGVINLKVKNKEFEHFRFVRPEDIRKYQEVTDVNDFKLSGRTMPESWILNVMTSYLKEKHDGNFVDLFPFIRGKIDNEGQSAKEYIDNKELDERFMETVIGEKKRVKKKL